MQKFSVGDRVSSNIQGFYYHVHGTIIKRNQIQTDPYGVNYIIDLDCGKRVSINSKYLNKLEEGE